MRNFTVAILVITMLAGCTTLKRATGQIDDTILPGQRQEILPPDQQVLRDPNVVGSQNVSPPGVQAQTAPATPGLVSTAPGATACDPKVDYCANSAAPVDASASTIKKAAAKKKKTNKKKALQSSSPPPSDTVPPPAIPTAPQPPTQ